VSGEAKLGLVLPTILTVAALAVLLGLGTWQMQRRAWKDGLLSQIAERLAAPPIPFDEALARSRKGEDLEYTRVAVAGRWLPAREWHLWAPSTSGPGWHVYAPLATTSGPIVIVNRGFVPDIRRDPATRPEPAQPNGVELVGLLRRPEVKSTFTPENAPDRNTWYWRDRDGMAHTLTNEAKVPVAPFFLDAEKSPSAAPSGLEGGVTRLDIPNNHLQYALTWYGLAATLLGVYTAFAWTGLKGRRAQSSSP
jgi:surfeit locus 1 family protein